MPDPFFQTDWPNPGLRVNTPAWQQSLTQSLFIPRDADYFYADVWITVGGVQYVQSLDQIDYDSLTVTGVRDQTPNTCRFVARGFTPTVGQEVVITLGSATTPNPERIFAGTILQVDQLYKGTPANQWFQVSCIDWTWQLNRQKVTKRYTGWTATAVVIDLISTYAVGFTCNHVAGLEVIDLITFTNQDLMSALTQVAKRIGGYWYIDYLKDLHFFTTEVDSAPETLTLSHPSLSDFAITRDLSQWFTRAYSEGGGGNAATEVAVGETILPLDLYDWYNDLGGVVVSGPQRITYTGRAVGGGGSLVGPGAAPSATPTLTLVVGDGLGDGDYQYAFTFVTGAGESLPGPRATITVGATNSVTAPASGPTVDPNGSGTANYNAGTALLYGYAYRTAGGETVIGPRTATNSVSNGAGASKTIEVTAPCSPDTTVTLVIFYESHDAGVLFRQFDSITNVPGTNVTAINTGPGVAIYNPRSSNVTPTAIALGPTGTTSRKLYRTAVGGSQLKLQQTIGDNTTTIGVQDSTADGALGANAPSSDTSGLTQPDGQILAGATTLLLSGAGAFSATGGWAVIGNGQQVIRYTGITSNTLTGIPATGSGAIVASISYNSTATAAPQLTGIPASGAGSILYTIMKGDPVNLLAQVNDAAGQTALSALLDPADLLNGAAGIVEDYQQDGRIIYTEAVARATARLAQRGAVEERITYSVRDPLTTVGKMIVVNLPAPTSVTASYQIQQVTITKFRSGTFFPTYTAEASSNRFTFEDLLRNIITREGG